MMEMIPLGFRFNPTDETLINDYLFKLAMGLPIPINHHILEKQLYGQNAHPQNVFCDVDDSHWNLDDENETNNVIKRVIYVFTKLSKINQGKKRISRRAGNGTWASQTGTRNIYDQSKRLIGYMKMFTFEADDKRKAVAGRERDGDHWIMHEYSLAGVSLNPQLKHKDYVLCRIKRWSRDQNYQQQQPISQIWAELSSTCQENESRSGTNGSTSADAVELRVEEGARFKKRKTSNYRSTTTTVQEAQPAKDSNVETSVCNDDNEAARMLPELSVPSPSSPCSGEWTQEDLEILNSILL